MTKCYIQQNKYEEFQEYNEDMRSTLGLIRQLMHASSRILLPVSRCSDKNKEMKVAPYTAKEPGENCLDRRQKLKILF